MLIRCYVRGRLLENVDVDIDVVAALSMLDDDEVDEGSFQRRLLDDFN